MANHISHALKMSPEMEALPETRRAFVEQLLAQGGTNHTRAYMIAYGSSEDSANANAYRLMADPRVQAAIRAEADNRLRGGALLGASVLMQIAADPLHKKQFNAAVELLNRAGLVVATEHKVTVDDRRSVDEIKMRIGQLAKDLGVDARKLLGESTVVDAQFEEISFEGLEDI